MINRLEKLDHIDVYIFMEYGHRISPVFTQEGTIKMISQALDLPDIHELTVQQYKLFFRMNAPKTKYLVHRLREMGFSPRTISLWLDINATSVSYHLKRPLVSKYRCPNLVKYLQTIGNVLQEEPSF
jgi:hypothetical protein